MKLFRIGHLTDTAGMWYSASGDFTGKMHDSTLTNRDLKMEFDAEVAGNLSVCKSFADLLNWFPLADIQNLYAEGYCVMIYHCQKPKWYKRFQHYLIPSTLKPAEILYSFDQITEYVKGENHGIAV